MSKPIQPYANLFGCFHKSSHSKAVVITETKESREAKLKAFVEKLTHITKNSFSELLGHPSAIPSGMVSTIVREVIPDNPVQYADVTQIGSLEDVRIKLLLGISNNYRNTDIPTSEVTVDPKKVEVWQDLSLEELMKLQALKLILERGLQKLPESNLKSLYSNCTNIALNRTLFDSQLNSESKKVARVTKPTSSDLKVMSCINVLTKHPDLRASYESFNNSISGMLELKTSLFLDVIFRWSKSSLSKDYNAFPPNGILFYGPPGCGKTHIAKALAKASNAKFVEFSHGSHGSFWKNLTTMKIHQLFKDAFDDYKKNNVKTVIFLDEASAILPNRQLLHSSSKDQEQEVSQFLRHMENCTRKGVLVLLATNLPEQIDSAAMRSGRVDKKYYIGPPDEASRKEIFKHYLKNIKKVSNDINYDILANKTPNYIAADIKALVENVCGEAMEDKGTITMSRLIRAISTTPPSLTIHELNEYTGAE